MSSDTFDGGCEAETNEPIEILYDIDIKNKSSYNIMETKEELVSHIKNWIQLDNNISTLQKQIKELREQKKNLTGDLVNVMKSNEIDCFDINNGKLMYSRTRVKKPINKSSLLLALKEYFGEDKNVAEIGEHILNSREESIKETIRRKTNK
jgi:hypothetical protein